MEDYITKTCCFRLYRRRTQAFYRTKALYGEIVTFYANLLLQHNEWLKEPNRTILRKLEILTLGEKRKGIEPEIKAECLKGKVPLYFRRAAVNEAIALARSCASKGRYEVAAVQANPVFYKGMYRNFKENSIELKLYDGERFFWKTYRFTTCGWKFPKEEQILSPALVMKGEDVYLHVPVKQTIKAAKSLEERMRRGENSLALAFSMGEVFAAGVCITPGGKEGAVRFVRGGEAFIRERRQLEAELQRLLSLAEEETKRITKIKEELRDLIKRTAHQAANEILSFAGEQDCGILIVPAYNGTFALNPESELPVSRYDWLGARIIDYLSHKAPKYGMTIHRVFVKGSASKCSLCGSPIKRYSESLKKEQYYGGRKLYVCENGHRGNSTLNTARNLGHKFLQDCGCYSHPKETGN